MTPSTFLDELMAILNPQNEESEHIHELKKNLEQMINDRIMSAVALYLDEKAIDEVMEKNPEQTDGDRIFAELVKASPQAQVGILAEMEVLKSELLDAHKDLVN